MGFGGISIWQLLIILVIVLLLFGTKKLRNLGGDLGGAVRGFKKAVSEENAANAEKDDTAEAIADSADADSGQPAEPSEGAAKVVERRKDGKD